MIAISSIVILKTGQFESFAQDNGESYSLGDVLRSTSLLQVLGESKRIKWLTQPRALPLLKNSALLEIDIFNANQLELQTAGFDYILNLEKNIILKDFLSSHQVIGFFLKNSSWHLRDILQNEYTLAEWNSYCLKTGAQSWGQKLQLILNRKSLHTLPIIAKPNISRTSDIGFNWHVGPKWPSKKIEDLVWKKLELHLSQKYKISWQQGLDSIEEYSQWVASNRLIISVDSLGLHLAHALDIPVIGLFGSTDYKLHENSPRSHYITFDAPKVDYACLPCWKSHCFQKTHCSEHLDLNKIYTLIDKYLGV